MANHVEFSLSFQRLTDEALDFLVELFDGVEDLHEIECIDDVGAKWATVEDAAEDRDGKEFFILGTAAWSAPWGIQDIHTKLLEFAPDCIGVFFYSDEMPLFAGAYTLEPYRDEDTDELFSSEDGAHWEDADIYDKLKETNPEFFKEHDVDPDLDLYEAQDEHEELEELWNDTCWDVISDLQRVMIEDNMSYL
jgi:hypothetical protein